MIKPSEIKSYSFDEWRAYQAERNQHHFWQTLEWKASQEWSPDEVKMGKWFHFEHVTQEEYMEFAEKIYDKLVALGWEVIPGPEFYEGKVSIMLRIPSNEE